MEILNAAKFPPAIAARLRELTTGSVVFGYELSQGIQIPDGKRSMISIHWEQSTPPPGSGLNYSGGNHDPEIMATIWAVGHNSRAEGIDSIESANALCDCIEKLVFDVFLSQIFYQTSWGLFNPETGEGLTHGGTTFIRRISGGFIETGKAEIAIKSVAMTFRLRGIPEEVPTEPLGPIDEESDIILISEDPGSTP